MRGPVVCFIVGLLALGVSAAEHVKPKPALSPTTVIDLQQIGWKPPRTESNRAFFKDFTLSKLFAVDDNTRVTFLTEDLLVVDHTIQEGNDWRAAPRRMQAFLVQAKSGALLATNDWVTRPRTAMDDRFDSESRITPLHEGHFVVLANGTLLLYSSTFELLKQRKLEPYAAGDRCAVQSTGAGTTIFLRQESKSGKVIYSWLNVDTLDTTYEMPGYGEGELAFVQAAEDAVFTLSKVGVERVDQNRRITEIPVPMTFPGTGLVTVLSTRYVGVTDRNGIRIVDVKNGSVWARDVEKRYIDRAFAFGELKPTVPGNRFAVSVVSVQKGKFDGIEINSNPTILVYEVVTPKEPTVIRLKPRASDWDFALSPSGQRLAVFDGKNVEIYTLD